VSAPKDGGPAFPIAVPDQRFPDGQPIQQGFFESGMSLRDWFASQAINTVLAQAYGSTPEILAAKTYELADAMLAAREKGRTP
jgi:hypothetical protein